MRFPFYFLIFFLFFSFDHLNIPQNSDIVSCNATARYRKGLEVGKFCTPGKYHFEIKVAKNKTKRKEK